jgi:hypothetical protein
VQTSVKSPYDDVHDADAGQIIYKYRGTDLKHPDNVALRNAMLQQVPVIYLVAVDPGFYDAVLPVYVAGDDPASLQFTLVADQISADIYASDPVKTAARREYATRAVLQRLHQQEFRHMVLLAYRKKCCICRLGHMELLRVYPEQSEGPSSRTSSPIGIPRVSPSSPTASASARSTTRRMTRTSSASIPTLGCTSGWTSFMRRTVRCSSTDSRKWRGTSSFFRRRSISIPTGTFWPSDSTGSMLRSVAAN